MSPDQQFARLVRVAMFGFAFIFIYFLIADLKMPVTTESMATRSIVKVAPQVSGRIEHVNVHNNQMVKKGDVLFEIDSSPFQLAVDEARLSLEQAKQNNQELDAALEAAEANVHASESISEQRNREANRMVNLLKNHGVSQQERDQAVSNARSARANLLAAKAELEKIKVTRGLGGEDNLSIRQAQNHLKQAELNLSYTRVVAENDGLITNLHLQEGSFKNAGSPALALVSPKVDIIADFREKNIAYTQQGDHAIVAFDGRPGQLFDAIVESIDAGVSSGQFDANGQLATPTSSDRWVRDAQRLRLHLKLVNPLEFPAAAGARTTVQLLPDNHFFALLAKVQIKFISLLHYVY
ncbi:HlyD family secretion protein [Vibrio rumoiensis]|uniref:HlyD family secretion protein n=1 Tax=Vibrio rumoiensis TaxID=76258 RepID=A0ABW7IZM6_9VIBR